MVQQLMLAQSDSLTISGTDSLTAISDNWEAGIGSELRRPSGNIAINSKTITASGGVSADIGGEYNGLNDESITLNGGTIIASSQTGAGIDSGAVGSIS